MIDYLFPASSWQTIAVRAVSLHRLCLSVAGDTTQHLRYTEALYAETVWLLCSLNRANFERDFERGLRMAAPELATQGKVFSWRVPRKLVGATQTTHRMVLDRSDTFNEDRSGVCIYRLATSRCYTYHMPRCPRVS